MAKSIKTNPITLSMWLWVSSETYQKTHQEKISSCCESGCLYLLSYTDGTDKTCSSRSSSN